MTPPAHLQSLVLWALTLGLVQGFGHCAGMCGPFLLAFGARVATRRTPVSATAHQESSPLQASSRVPLLPLFPGLPNPAILARLPGSALSVSSPSGASPSGRRPMALALTGVNDPDGYGSATPTRARSSWLAWPDLLFHHAGRITAFGCLGAAAGAVGSLTDLAAGARGLDGVAAVAGGGLMLAWAVDQARTGRGGQALERFSLLRTARVSSWFRRVQRAEGHGTAFASGFLLGLHPCGLIFAALLSAAATGRPLSGAITLLAFGLGTLPALAGVSVFGFFAAAALRGTTFRLLSASWVGVCGVLFLLRGLALDRLVPSVNPWLF